MAKNILEQLMQGADVSDVYKNMDILAKFMEGYGKKAAELGGGVAAQNFQTGGAPNMIDKGHNFVNMFMQNSQTPMTQGMIGEQGGKTLAALFGQQQGMQPQQPTAQPPVAPIAPQATTPQANTPEATATSASAGESGMAKWGRALMMMGMGLQGKDPSDVLVNLSKVKMINGSTTVTHINQDTGQPTTADDPRAFSYLSIPNPDGSSTKLPLDKTSDLKLVADATKTQLDALNKQIDQELKGRSKWSVAVGGKSKRLQDMLKESDNLQNNLQTIKERMAAKTSSKKTSETKQKSSFSHLWE